MMRKIFSFSLFSFFYLTGLGWADDQRSSFDAWRQQRDQARIEHHQQAGQPTVTPVPGVTPPASSVDPNAPQKISSATHPTATIIQTTDAMGRIFCTIDVDDATLHMHLKNTRFINFGKTKKACADMLQ